MSLPSDNHSMAMPDDTIRKKRKKSGGNTRKMYTEGWVEFEDKKIAKQVALALNNTMIGGKKTSYYREDIWNIKYLSKFKWEHLTEKNGGSFAFAPSTAAEYLFSRISI